MPIYQFHCPDCGINAVEYRKMSESSDPCKCEICSREMYRDFRAEKPGPALDTEFHTPIEMHSIGLCNDEDIRDFRQRNPDVKIGTDPRRDDYGVPIAHTRNEKLKILKNEGFEERN